MLCWAENQGMQLRAGSLGTALRFGGEKEVCRFFFHLVQFPWV